MPQQVALGTDWNSERETLTLQTFLGGGKLSDAISSVSNVFRLFHGKRPDDGGPNAGKTLSRRGVVEDGEGKFIQVNLHVNRGHTTEALGELQPISPAKKEIAKHGAWKYRDIWSHTTVSRRDQDENKGKARIANLVEAKAKDLVGGVAEDFEGYYVGDGSGLGGEAPDGLQVLVKATPTSGYVGSLLQSNATVAGFWRNKYSADMKAAAYQAQFLNDLQGISDLQEMRMRCGLQSKGAGTDLSYPDYILVSTNVWLAYQKLALEFRESGAAMTSELGFTAATFAGAYILPVPSMDAEATIVGTNAGIARFINTQHMFAVVDPARNFTTPAWEEVTPLQPMDKIAKTGYRGNLVVDSLEKHGYLQWTSVAS